MIRTERESKNSMAHSLSEKEIHAFSELTFLGMMEVTACTMSLMTEGERVREIASTVPLTSIAGLSSGPIIIACMEQGSRIWRERGRIEGVREE